MIEETALKEVHRLLASGTGEYDTLHAAYAKAGQADLFVSTDDCLLKRPQAVG